MSPRYKKLEPIGIFSVHGPPCKIGNHETQCEIRPRVEEEGVVHRHNARVGVTGGFFKLRCLVVCIFEILWSTTHWSVLRVVFLIVIFFGCMICVLMKNNDGLFILNNCLSVCLSICVRVWEWFGMNDRLRWLWKFFFRNMVYVLKRMKFNL